MDPSGEHEDKIETRNGASEVIKLYLTLHSPSRTWSRTPQRRLLLRVACRPGVFTTFAAAAAAFCLEVNDEDEDEDEDEDDEEAVEDRGGRGLRYFSQIRIRLALKSMASW